MARPSTAARRYAEAVFEIAADAGETFTEPQVRPPAEHRARDDEARLATDEDRRQLEGSVRQEPGCQKDPLAIREVVEYHHSDQGAIVKEQDEGEDAPEESRHHRQDRDLRVVGHELRREGVPSLEGVEILLLLALHPFRGFLVEVGELRRNEIGL